MKSFFTIAVLFTVLHLHAQQKDTIEQYAAMKVNWGDLFFETTIEIDYGEQGFTGFRNRLKDTVTGKLIKFKSPVEALNYMGKQGWKLVNTVSNNTDNSSYIYIFKKEIMIPTTKEWF